MIEIEKPRIDCENLAEDGSYGKFVVEPLERGYGTTLGNSLRRIPRIFCAPQFGLKQCLRAPRAP